MPNHPNHMYLVYIDESYDETNFAYSAIFINAFRWNDYFNQLLEWRGEWKEKADVGQPSPFYYFGEAIHLHNHIYRQSPIVSMLKKA